MPARLRHAGLFAALAAATSASVACSSADFSVAAPGEDASADTGVVSDSASDVVIQPGEVGSDAVVTNCPTLNDPTEVWVDAASTAPKAATGASDCPFKQVTDAVAYLATLPVKPRTIRVRPGTYDEPASVRVRSGITLQGAGIDKVTIKGGGTCLDSPSFTCVIGVDAGGLVDGVLVDAASSGKHGIATGAAGSAGNPKLSNLRVTGAIGEGLTGVLVTAGALLGPAVDITGNSTGLTIWGSQAVGFTGGGNKIDANAEVGIDHQGTGVLSMGGGSVSRNAAGGIRVGQTSLGTGLNPPQHLIGNVTIANNGNFGINIGASAGIKLRNATILNNTLGVIATYGVNNVLDFGTSSTDPGGNTFGTTTAKNPHGALCLIATRNDSTPIAGDKFSGCPAVVTQLSGGGCDSVVASAVDADVWYRGLSAPSVLGCAVGS
jgi:hypothetical protein